MKKTTLTFLGSFSGVSKKTGNAFKGYHFYRASEKNIGYEPLTLFPDSECAAVLDTKKPLDKIDVDLRYINGSNVIISIF